MLQTIPACCRQLAFPRRFGYELQTAASFPRASQFDVCRCKQSVVTTQLMSGNAMTDAQIGHGKAVQTQRGEVGVTVN